MTHINTYAKMLREKINANRYSGLGALSELNPLWEYVGHPSLKLNESYLPLSKVFWKMTLGFGHA